MKHHERKRVTTTRTYDLEEHEVIEAVKKHVEQGFNINLNPADTVEINVMHGVCVGATVIELTQEEK